MSTGVLVERDPVCGMSVDPQKAAAKVEHAGKTYFFCAPGCARRFEKEPEKYLRAMQAPAIDQRSSAAPPLVSIASRAQQRAPDASASEKHTEGIRYTCPMHPQIVQLGPGSC